MNPFKQHIRASLENDNLQIALDGNVERRLKGRSVALASVPDWPERRQRAHAIRAGVIEHLDEYLGQFIARVQANGITVHRAANAAEAVNTILEIARTVPEPPGRPLLFAKSKSMVSEEIALNHALEAAGHRVVETDLGEYIIQLRGERPSHIITPAVHLRRGQVGQLFHEKLGIPYTEDIPTLTNTARKVLREVFLTADIGLSGVNFGVAETGTLTLVTNEGNGRMVTTLPPVHIALMGMERLVPNLDDLALLLSMLPRSATGQKLSVYTQFIHRPLPGQQRHLVILDNGRSQMRQSALREALYCIRCGACLNACPVFREIGGHGYVGSTGAAVTYPGPIGSVISAGLFGGDEYGNLAQASSLCGACKEACPVDIDLPKLLLRIRAGQVKQESEPARSGLGLPATLKLGIKLFAWGASRPRLFSVAQKGMGLAAAPLAGGFIPLPAVTGWGYSKDFPAPAARPFRERFASLDRTPARSIPAPDTLPLPVQAPAPVAAPGLVEQFTTELAALGGQVYPLSAADLPQRLVDFLVQRGIERVEMWAHVPGLDPAHLAQAGIRVVGSAPDVTAGITGALCAIAETGSLLLPGGAGQPLTASLVPPIHIAVLRTSQVLPTLAEALHLPEVTAAPAGAIITGPSRTADIEMTLTIGVHGPGEVHVFLVDA